MFHLWTGMDFSSLLCNKGLMKGWTCRICQNSIEKNTQLVYMIRTQDVDHGLPPLERELL